ncbi:MerR family transcriptional regulator [Streptomyces olivochromogenes]|uniref:Putative thiol-specific antioxidant related protein/Peroxidoxin BcpB n=1 Tax=Streptomyces olivochromogenes TaxID=1963 RepID=A0A250VI64_STROL|nr:MerR family transcriptional regulator [Streptomyces olivochromogenes]KUN43174.1 peroxiredoxin [Streptomyces olivochromogenes]GAX53861.1 putative thiol-specific antioxidant related protein/Peroxidoxin BcpB [Streptomyces olivochromogenes]
MRVGELARRAGVTVRALRYYEAAGLVVPRRLPNGYRDYAPMAVRQVEEIRTLTGLGLSVEDTRPFVECLASGHDVGDECPASLATYRRSIRDLSERIRQLTERRDTLAAHLEASARRSIPDSPEGNARAGISVSPEVSAPSPVPVPADPAWLPPGLPRPPDDGGAAHLPGGRLPDLVLPATDGRAVGLGALGPGRTVLYVYPLSGRPGTDLPDGWDTIPGARGCTAEACAFRDHHEDLRAAGAARVYGLSSQSPEYQRELADRLHLPFAILSDTEFALREALDLPTFTADGRTLYRRLTMIVNRGAIEHVFYPVFPTDQHAAEVLDWLRLQDPQQGETAHDREGHPLSVPRPPR